MALTPSRSGRFKKDYMLMTRRGKDVSKILLVMKTLADEVPLKPKHRDHVLVGNYGGCRECHVEPDWLLIYTVGGDWIRFERTGTHADLFD
jgi:mRNA interferase YafQ